MNIPYSEIDPDVGNVPSRKRVAREIIAVLTRHVGKDTLRSVQMLDIGCSTGIVTHEIGSFVKSITGIDTDTTDLARAKRSYEKNNITFLLQDAQRTDFRDQSFDVIICHQTYHCVEDGAALFKEIYRLLPPGGICYFGGPSLFGWHKGKRKYTYHAATIGTLRLWCRKFIIYDYTPKILTDPGSYEFSRLVPYQRILRIVPKHIYEWLEPFIPNLIWMLEKP